MTILHIGPGFQKSYVSTHGIGTYCEQLFSPIEVGKQRLMTDNDANVTPEGPQDINVSIMGKETSQNRYLDTSAVFGRG